MLNKEYPQIKVYFRKKLVSLLDYLWGRISDDLTYSELEKKYLQTCYHLKQLKTELECLRNTRQV